MCAVLANGHHEVGGSFQKEKEQSCRAMELYFFWHLLVIRRFGRQTTIGKQLRS